MDSKSHHAPLKFQVEPNPDPRINSPITIIELCYAKTVENSLFCEKKYFRLSRSYPFETAESHPTESEGNPGQSAPFKPPPTLSPPLEPPAANPETPASPG